MMRLVFVNHSHPSMPHVSGMRAWEFGRELATRGHQVVLVCEWREGVAPPPQPEAVAEHLQRHDWSQPFIVAVRPTRVPVLERVRSSQTGNLPRKMMVAQSYLASSGMFGDFTAGAHPYLLALARLFKPEAVWATFGNTDCWLIAQRLARLSNCRWIADMKDAWDWWIPAGLRTILARRFSDMSASTANSEFNATALTRWFPTEPAVVYSGVHPNWLEALPPQADGFRMMLVGGVYEQESFRTFVNGLTAWVQQVPPRERERISLCYAGSDADRVRAATTELASAIRVDIRGYVALPELASLCRSAAVNVYLWSPTTFHHKVIELLCCRRPIVSFPGERAESVELARQVGGSLNVCSTREELHATLDAIWKGGCQPSSLSERLSQFTWTAQANRLEQVLCVP